MPHTQSAVWALYSARSPVLRASSLLQNTPQWRDLADAASSDLFGAVCSWNRSFLPILSVGGQGELNARTFYAILSTASRCYIRSLWQVQI